MLKAGVIGFGYWGPNIVRNFNANKDIQVVKICDLDEGRVQAAKKSYENIEVTSDTDSLINDPTIDIIAVITPVYTHYDLVKKALLQDKHVFVEKPFTSTSDQAKELIDIADSRNKLIMVDHTFLFTGAVQKMKQLISNNEIGDLYYYDSVRVNLGLFQHDINVIWDLAPHDLSIMLYLLGDSEIYSVNANGVAHFKENIEDIAYLNVNFNSNFIAHFHSNWLSPVKVRKTLIAGSKKMLVWDDLENDEKMKIYDKGVNVSTKEGVYNQLIQYRTGDMYAPKIENIEALKSETEYFVKCIKENIQPFNNGVAGLDVVKILEASTLSLKEKGKEIKL